jgi:Domain of unknown function (DUF4394)/FG-GAP-like repeat
MRNRTRSCWLLAFLAVLAPVTASAETLFALIAPRSLVRFDSAAPDAILGGALITGLAGTSGEVLVGIDFRPATRELYALSVDGAGAGRTYRIHPVSGVATLIGTIVFPLLSNGAVYGVDFNPVVDRIRVVNAFNENIRINPNNGSLAGDDPNLTYTAPATGPLAAIAYDRSFAGTTLTTLFGIDRGSSRLVRIGGVDGTPSPNLGVVTSVGALGVTVDAGTDAGFDISGATGTAYAVLVVGGLYRLYTINLATAAATLVGTVADGSLTVRGFAVAPPGIGVAREPADFDGDGVADIGVYRTTTGEWLIRRSRDATLLLVAWGSPFLNDFPVFADYDGDGLVDIAVYRRNTGEWFIRRSVNGSLLLVPFGSPFLNDVPAPADYDGDGKVDVAVYRQDTGQWFILRSTDGMLMLVDWGSPPLGDLPLPVRR